MRQEILAVEPAGRPWSERRWRKSPAASRSPKPWDYVRFFLAMARAGSLSGAARVLGVGHVTVGRRIALFEKRLGVTLLNRIPDGLLSPRPPRWVTTTEALAYQVVAPAIATLLAELRRLARSEDRQGYFRALQEKRLSAAHGGRGRPAQIPAAGCRP